MNAKKEEPKSNKYIHVLNNLEKLKEKKVKLKVYKKKIDEPFMCSFIILFSSTVQFQKILSIIKRTE